VKQQTLRQAEEIIDRIMKIAVQLPADEKEEFFDTIKGAVE